MFDNARAGIAMSSSTAYIDVVSFFAGAHGLDLASDLESHSSPLAFSEHRSPEAVLVISCS